jgi:hypothetical protein
MTIGCPSMRTKSQTSGPITSDAAPSLQQPGAWWALPDSSRYRLVREVRTVRLYGWCGGCLRGVPRSDSALILVDRYGNEA